MRMSWDVEFHDAFEEEFLAFEQSVQDALLAVAKLLAEYARNSVGRTRTRSKARSTPI